MTFTPASDTSKLGNYKFTKDCRECGAKFGAQRDHAKYCSRACLSVYNNRRQKRGAECYDALMNWRFGHEDNKGQSKGARAKADDVAKRLHGCDMRTLLCSIAAGFKAADDAARDGRPSWFSVEDLTEFLGRLPACDDGR